MVGVLNISCTLDSGADCSYISDTLTDLFKPAIFPKGEPALVHDNSNTISEVVITLASDVYAVDVVSMNESYQISIEEYRITIRAITPDGLARAFATLCEIIEPDPGFLHDAGRYIVWHEEIIDAPAYRYRELLVDAARHYLPLKTLKRISLGLALAKMNVLHVHIVDSEANSFAPESEPASNMDKAAWQNGKFYVLTKEDLRELELYIRPLGIFLMVEYDMPGHATSWQKADPSIVTNCPAHGYTSINPINELTYEYIDAYVKDVFEAATYIGATPIIHLGGDEVDHGCWNEDPDIVEYMNDHSLSTISLWEEFHSRVLQIVQNASSNAFIEYWQESYENGNKMAQNAIINFWANTNMLTDCLMSGHYAVRTQGWYFDVVQQGASRYLFEDSWMDFYAVNIGANVPTIVREKMLGGGACLWGEYVDSGSIDDFAFPRIIAVSESLWSDPVDRNITHELVERFNEFACKSQEIGVKNGPLAPSKPCVGVDYA